jgi:hypothetical protein
MQRPSGNQHPRNPQNQNPKLTINQPAQPPPGQRAWAPTTIVQPIPQRLWAEDPLQRWNRRDEGNQGNQNPNPITDQPAPVQQQQRARAPTTIVHPDPQRPSAEVPLQRGNPNQTTNQPAPGQQQQRARAAATIAQPIPRRAEDPTQNLLNGVVHRLEAIASEMEASRDREIEREEEARARGGVLPEEQGEEEEEEEEEGWIFGRRWGVVEEDSEDDG